MTPEVPLSAMLEGFDSEHFAAARLELHWLSQLVAMAATASLESADDDSHTNLFVTPREFQGRPLGERGTLSVDPGTMVIKLGEQTFPMAGKRLKDGMSWLKERLGCDVALPEYGLPDRPIDKPFEMNRAECQVHAWFRLATDLLGDVAKRHGGGEVRLWPHHFDIATLIALDGDAVSEEARSINAGLSPGDSSYDIPYFYVTPWPRPEGKLPQLDVGHWHTDGFNAAVLPASAIEGPVEEVARDFLEQALGHSQTLLARS